MNADQIRTHIAAIIKEKHKNLRALSLAIGKNEAYLHQFVHKGSPVRLPEEDRRKLAQLLNVNEQDLTDLQLPSTPLSQNSRPNTALIEILSNQLSPKSIGFVSLPMSDFSNISSCKPDTVKIFRICGDAMTPTLKDGDYVVSDLSQTNFSTDGLYAVILNNQLCIKRLQQISHDEFLLISDNTNYKSFSVLAKNIQISGKIIGAFKLEKIA